MAVAEWFFLRGRTENGPFTLDQIESYFSSGSITEETYLWRPGCTDWFPLAAFQEFAAMLQPPMAYADEVHGDELQADPRDMAVAPSEPTAPVNSRQWVDESPHPWRRYFARYLDYFVWFMVLTFLLSFGLAAVDEQKFLQFIEMIQEPVGLLIVAVVGTILVAVVNAILIGLTGGNLGKWLFGVRVLDEAGRPIGLLRSLNRECRVLLIGLGLGIPIVSVATMILAYLKLKKDGVTRWDQALALRVVHRKTGAVQYIGYLVGFILIIGIFGLVGWFQQLM